MIRRSVIYLPGTTGTLALSWQVWLVSSVTAQILVFLFGIRPISFVTALSIPGVVISAAPIMLSIGRWLLPKVENSRNRLLLVIATYLATAFLMACSMQLVLILGGQLSGMSLLQSVPGMFFYTWFFILVSELVNDRYSYRAALHRLNTSRAQLEQAHALYRETSLITPKDEVERVVQQVQMAYAHLLAKVGAQSELRGVAEQATKELLSNVTSFSLRSEAAAPIEMTNLARKRSFLVVLNTAFSPLPELLVPGAAFIATSWVVTGLTLQNWFVAIGATIIATVMYAALLFVAVRVVLPKIEPFRLSARIPLVIAVWAVVGLLSGLVPLYLAGIPAGALISIMVQTSITLAAISLVLAYRKVGEEVNAGIAAANERTERELTESALQLRDTRSRLHSFIHSDVQAAFVALEQRLFVSSNLSATAAENLRIEFDGILEKLNQLSSEESELPNAFDAIIDLQLLWNGSIDISVGWSPEARKAVSQSMITSSVLSEVLIEIVTNAAKHDRATDIQIMMSMDGPRTLRVVSISRYSQSERVRGEHREVAVSEKPSGREVKLRGLGSKLFDEVCLQWQIEPECDHTRFEALMPVLPTQATVMHDEVKA